MSPRLSNTFLSEFFDKSLILIIAHIKRTNGVTSKKRKDSMGAGIGRKSRYKSIKLLVDAINSRPVIQIMNISIGLRIRFSMDSLSQILFLIAKNIPIG